MDKNVALVLSSGSSRGLAHIGAIEALQDRGYVITSIAGCSMGAIVAGMFAAGKINELKDWFLDMTPKRMFELTDFTLSKNYFVKGEKLSEALGKLIPNYQIENLKIPLTLVATDMQRGAEVILRSGDLNRAIRASFALPVILQPVRMEDMILMDGGISNPLPLNRVERQPNDILVSVNVSAAYINKPMAEEVSNENLSKLTALLGNSNAPSHFERLLEIYTKSNSKPSEKQMGSLAILDRCSDVMIQQYSELMKRFCPPDINVDIAMDQFGAFEYDHAEEIIHFGYNKMIVSINEYEKKQD